MGTNTNILVLGTLHPDASAVACPNAHAWSAIWAAAPRWFAVEAASVADEIDVIPAGGKRGGAVPRRRKLQLGQH